MEILRHRTVTVVEMAVVVLWGGVVVRVVLVEKPLGPLLAARMGFDPVVEVAADLKLRVLAAAVLRGWSS